VKKTINKAVQEAVDEYLHMMDDEQVTDLYELVLSEVEAPLLRSILNHTNQNQSKASAALGLNRATLRKKLRKYRLL
jgi:Fis family transcriptional regulator